MICQHILHSSIYFTDVLILKPGLLPGLELDFSSEIVQIQGIQNCVGPQISSFQDPYSSSDSGDDCFQLSLIYLRNLFKSFLSPK